ncbi:DUF5391 family protein [Shouchella lonarensis]|uniref:Uncharacterized protein n=1 Tax=Shouchella lonarensis TaxID=1464122 RepID=A0A1G6GPH0_9BACI|nr:DUF5391 family protein [Shouchella lonarensis]SDB83831.1 hypothetical protein SAMN05421737_101326 [Shouchella lonarensis]
MNHKKRAVTLVTILSALFCSGIIVAGSLSSAATSGPTTNQFGDVGMWVAIGMMLIPYVICLVPYALGINSMKYVMAVCNVIGLMMALTTVAMVPIRMMTTSNMIAAGDIGLMVVAMGLMATNIIWFVVVFRREPHKVENYQV